MGFGSMWHWIVVLAVVMIVFGAGRIPQAMTDLAKGVKAFQRGMREDQTPPVSGPREGA
jgi:sec-independent protein translocase protein TatA